MTMARALGDEDDMTTEAGHGHGDDMTHGATDMITLVPTQDNTTC